MTAKTDEFDYQGQDLEAMVGAQNYYAWLFSIIKPYLGESIVEVGAGVGSFSQLLLNKEPKQLTLIEPSTRMHALLKENIGSSKKTNVNVVNGYLKDSTSVLKATNPDTFVYINVFEHIEKDQAEIKLIAKNLQKGGHVIIFVPALQGLYSEFDKSIDHYRRYSKASLCALCEAANLEVEQLRYMDMAGVVPWWFSFVLMKRTTLVPALVKTYDRFFVPVIRTAENIVTVPLGKNVLVIAKKK